MEAFAKLAKALSVPLALLNTFGGIVAGIWLIILGDWRIVVGGFFAALLATKLLGFALAPGLLLGVPAVAFGQRGNKLGMYFFGFLSQLYTVAVLTAWCIGVLVFFANRANDSSIIPLLLWSYGVGTSPISYMAQKEGQGGGGEGALIAAFFFPDRLRHCCAHGLLFWNTDRYRDWSLRRGNARRSCRPALHRIKDAGAILIAAH